MCMKPDISASRRHLVVRYADMIDIPVLFVYLQHCVIQLIPAVGKGVISTFSVRGGARTCSVTYVITVTAFVVSVLNDLDVT